MCAFGSKIVDQFVTLLTIKEKKGMLIIQRDLHCGFSGFEEKSC